MKTILLLITGLLFSQNVMEDKAYKLVSKKIDESVPDSFVRKAFSHQKLEIHNA